MPFLIGMFIVAPCLSFLLSVMPNRSGKTVVDHLCQLRYGLSFRFMVLLDDVNNSVYYIDTHTSRMTFLICDKIGVGSWTVL